MSGVAPSQASLFSSGWLRSIITKAVKADDEEAGAKKARESGN